MSIYLHDIPLKQAQSEFSDALKKGRIYGLLGKETIQLNEVAEGRILAESVWAKISTPNYHASAMDGFAVVADETNAANTTNPLTIPKNRAAYVDTGDPIPDWANSVIPIENVELLDQLGNQTNTRTLSTQIRIRASVAPWAHIRPLGEDMVATQLVIPAGYKLRPFDLGAIAACGNSTIVVARKPKVGIIPTGTELVTVGDKPERGQIIEFNSIMLAAQVNVWGGEAKRYPIVKDDFKLIKSIVTRASEENDLILLNAGSSAGSEDFSSKVVETLGELLVHGVAVRPGHPVILGMIHAKQEVEVEKVIPIIGVPGYPVSAAMTGEIFVKPLIEQWIGVQKQENQQVEAILTRKVTSPAGDDDYMRVVVGRVGERLLAAPLSRGAGVISSLARADGITIVPSSIQGLEVGSVIKVNLYRDPKELDKTIFAIGSHDMTLDILAKFLITKDRRLISSNVGSQGGLIAIQRGETHIAGTHLLDPETGIYNVRYLKQFAPNVSCQLIHWVDRSQGLMVQKGNPKEISDLQSLTKQGITFINRQRGSGTRMLLDYHLKQLGIDPKMIKGYEFEEYNHLTVAAAVASGRADCGMGVAAAANALDLGFIPLFNEQYDFAIPKEHIESHHLDPLFELMQDESLKQEILKMPGYSIENMGRLIGD